VKGTCAFLVVAALVLGGRSHARALVLGGGSPETDCYAVFDGVELDSSSRKVICTDGDARCDRDGIPDGVCRLDIRICAHVPGIPGCRPRRIGDITVGGFSRGGGPFTIPVPVTPISRERCGDFARVSVPLRRTGSGVKVGKARIKLVAVSRVLHPKKDKDKLDIRCVPNPSPCIDVNCPGELDLTVASTGSDLDTGATGAGHNFSWPDGWKLGLALSGCNAIAYPLCTVTGPRGSTFGPPLPLLSAGVPACVVDGFADPSIGGTANVLTGAIHATVNVSANVHLTSVVQICPRCTGAAVGDAGTCDSGPNKGAPCTVEGIATVADASAGDNTYSLSAGCPPEPGTLVAPVALTFPLVTGVSTLLGPSPCSPPDGPPIPDDACGEGTCSDGICTDCASTTLAGECIAHKGGVQQACCSNAPKLPCFPTAPESDGRLERVGFSVQPQPPWPDPTYPKTASAKLVGAFCLPPTLVGQGPQATTIPNGPAALILPITEEWRLAPSS